jgi:hypothetical protein
MKTQKSKNQQKEILKEKTDKNEYTLLVGSKV